MRIGNYGSEYNDSINSKVRRCVPTEEYRDEIMRLYFVEGLSHQEIGKLLGINQNRCSKIIKY